MEYLSVKETAKKWGISERYVQRYCTDGRIDGAIKFSGSWAIPKDANKPNHLKRSTTPETIKTIEVPIVPVSSPFLNKQDKTFEHIPMPLLNTAFTLGHCMDSIINIDDNNTRSIALAEYYYFSGQAEKASEIAEKYLLSDDISLRLSACWIYGYANLALNRIPYARKALASVQKMLESIDESTSTEIRALIGAISFAASTLLHLPLPDNLPPIRQIIPLLPSGLRLFALYVQAHHAYLNQQYGASIGIVETALSLEGETYPIPSIYLHLVATMDYMSLKQPEQAKEHLLAAWHLAQPDDLIEAFGEHHGLLGGLLETIIKKEYPDDFKRIINITYNFSSGWRKIHNQITEHYVADNLTTTEFAIAMLAARDWSNKEISNHLGISTHTVKLHISSALQKLGISQRKEFIKYMLK